LNGSKGLYVGGTLISIVISLALYLSGKRESAIFVGLWAPTILNLGQILLEEDEGRGTLHSFLVGGAHRRPTMTTSTEMIGDHEPLQ
jgi:hypothetical protein